MYALVFFTKSKTTSVVNTNKIINPGPVSVGCITEVKWKKTKYDAKIILYNDSKALLEDIDVDTEGNIMRKNKQPTTRQLTGYSKKASNKIEKRNQNTARHKIARDFDNKLSHHSASTSETKAATITTSQDGDCEQGTLSALDDAVDPEVQNRGFQNQNPGTLQLNVADTGSRVSARASGDNILESMPDTEAESRRPCHACALLPSVSPELIRNLEASLTYIKALYEVQSSNAAAIESQQSHQENQISDQNADLSPCSNVILNHNVSSPSWKIRGFGKVELMEESGVWIDAEKLKTYTDTERNNPNELTRKLMKHLIGMQTLSQLCAIGGESAGKQGIDPNVRNAVKYYVEKNSSLNGKNYDDFNKIINAMCARLRSKADGKDKVPDPPKKKRGRPPKKLKLSYTSDRLQRTNEAHCRVPSPARSDSPSLASSTSSSDCDEMDSHRYHNAKEDSQSQPWVDHDELHTQTQVPPGTQQIQLLQLQRGLADPTNSSTFNNLRNNGHNSSMQVQPHIQAVEALASPSVDIQSVQSQQGFYQQASSHQGVPHFSGYNRQPNNRHNPGAAAQRSVETPHPLISSTSAIQSDQSHQSHDQSTSYDVSNFPAESLRQNSHNLTPQSQAHMHAVQPLTTPSSGIQLSQSQKFYQQTAGHQDFRQSADYKHQLNDHRDLGTAPRRCVEVVQPLIQPASMIQSRELHQSQRQSVCHLDVSKFSVVNLHQNGRNSTMVVNSEINAVQTQTTPSLGIQPGRSQRQFYQQAMSYQGVQLAGYHEQHHVRQNPSGTPHRITEAPQPLISSASTIQSGQLHQSVGHFDVSKLPVDQRQNGYNSTIQPQSYIHAVQPLTTPSPGIPLGQSQQLYQQAVGHHDVVQLAGYNRQQNVNHKKAAIPPGWVDNQQSAPHQNVAHLSFGNLRHSSNSGSSTMQVQTQNHAMQAVTTPSFGIQSNESQKQFYQRTTSHQGVAQSTGDNNGYNNRHEPAAALERSIETPQPQWDN